MSKNNKRATESV